MKGRRGRRAAKRSEVTTTGNEPQLTERSSLGSSQRYSTVPTSPPSFDVAEASERSDKLTARER